MELDDNTVIKIAKLARLKVEPNDIPSLKQKMISIIELNAKLQMLNTDNIEPLTTACICDFHARSDEITESNIENQLMQNAPKAGYGFFQVPKVIEE